MLENMLLGMRGMLLGKLAQAGSSVAWC